MGPNYRIEDEVRICSESAHHGIAQAFIPGVRDSIRKGGFIPSSSSQLWVKTHLFCGAHIPGMSCLPAGRNAGAIRTRTNQEEIQ